MSRKSKNRLSSPVPKGRLVRTRRRLPHWQWGGSVYFVTFSVQRHLGFVLDEEARALVVDAFRFWHGRKMRVHLVCVLPDHVHALIEPLPRGPKKWYNISEILHSIKSFTAHVLNRRLHRSGSIWQPESWDRIVRDEREYWRKWDYIFYNPVKAGLCQRPEEYPFLWKGR